MIVTVPYKSSVLFLLRVYEEEHYISGTKVLESLSLVLETVDEFADEWPLLKAECSWLELDADTSTYVCVEFEVLIFLMKDCRMS